MPFTTRDQARSVACPECGAKPGKPCRGLRRARLSCHLERHDEYQRRHGKGGRLWKAVTG
jgi:hypothetical protein